MGCECKYYYDISGKRWWKLDHNDSDWIPLPTDKVVELQLEAQLGYDFQINHTQLGSIDSPIDKGCYSPKQGLIDKVLSSLRSPSVIEGARSEYRRTNNSEESSNNHSSIGDNVKDNNVINNDMGDRSGGRRMSYVREATRRLTYKDPGGLSGCLKVIADTRKELLKDGESISFEVDENKSSLNYMINRAKKLAESTSKDKSEIKIEEQDETVNLQRKINKELKSPCYSDGDFSTGDSSDGSSSDSGSAIESKSGSHDNTGVSTTSLAQLMAIKMKLKSKIKSMNK